MNILKDIILTKIEDVITVYSPKGRLETIKNRKSYGLSFCLDGQITYTHNGKEYVSDKNHAIFLPKGQTYSLRGDKTGAFSLINFSADNFSCHEFNIIPINDTEALCRDFEQIKSLFFLERNRAKVISLFYDIIHKLSVSQSAVPGIMQKILRYVEKNYNKPHLTNEFIAKEFQISEVYLRKLFINYCNTSPRQYIIDIRLSRAKQFLETGHVKIGSVATECGFTNQYHFCRLFKKKVGITPTEYIKENQRYVI